MLQGGRIRHVKIKPPALIVRQGSRKLVREPITWGYRYLYYDLASDPAERDNLYLLNAESAADLIQLVAAYERDMAVRREAFWSRANTDPLALDVEREEALRALGYID